ncbi:hypothetical protein RJ641_015272 [Dillenia turbinata]|uniref:Uncharacterized protein n=1 Tax=Dillenia turbinata TaxID=194707 RepID=A0AAN8Z3J7_9MAGN
MDLIDTKAPLSVPETIEIRRLHQLFEELDSHFLDQKVPQTFIISWEAIPPTKAATAWSSAAPNRHISLIRSSVRVKPLHPMSLSNPTAMVFNLDISSSISLHNMERSYVAKHDYERQGSRDDKSRTSEVPIKLPRKSVVVTCKPISSSK